MQSLYDDYVAALNGATFSIPNVVVRDPYDESPKTYPLIVVHEIVNVPVNHATVSGEDRTALSYQIDIQTQTCTNTSDEVLSAFRAGQALATEVSDVLSADVKFTRRGNIRRVSIAPDVLQTTIRGDSVMDAYGYAYRP